MIRWGGGGVDAREGHSGEMKCFAFIFPHRNVDTGSSSNKPMCIIHPVSDINFPTQHADGRGGPSIIGWRLAEPRPTARVHKTITLLSFITRFSGSPIRNKRECLHSLLDKCVFSSVGLIFVSSRRAPHLHAAGIGPFRRSRGNGQTAVSSRR